MAIQGALTASIDNSLMEHKLRRDSLLVSREALEDLEGLHHPANEALLQSFENHTGKILDAVARAISDRSNFDDRGLLHVRTKDIEWGNTTTQRRRRIVWATFINEFKGSRANDRYSEPTLRVALLLARMGIPGKSVVYAG
ncbi:DUF1488 family protein [Rhodanobacter sp. T12-5]|uniref:DUF1488 family protein n=1 Tax=Rhodanobacter sp. T12-5 TaxID=2024611 RepID=UPI001562488B|nr:DUF1488 family protein [Rhodanobacter sp. T12-5]